MKQSVLIFVLAALSCLAYGRGDINYEHKAIQKTLEKSLSLVNPQLSELVLPANYATGFEGKFFNVACDNTDADIKYMYIGRVNSCRAGGCSMPSALSQGGESEYFDYLMVFNAKGEVIMVKVFNYQATHGHEVTAKGWLKQFIGYNTSENELEVGKNIDSISGATISVNGITQDISDKTQIINKYLGQS
ncbi:FMN-binding protein [Carboxylicivirga sp. A043]|uniref:FMN-binding protein n=1 Tax=Carboxylicivirga litoralis TaxID=2816963 RepID=UPI0021CB0545|nr:FMN-binding protein [Carboxylicivirga sp. A043]MCU4154697.1 FMN-binding protein [Carboxylicivirga sp. A043]